MRILHIDPDDIDNPMAGGGPWRTFEIYRRLADRHEITVLTPTFVGSEPEVMRDGIRYLRLGRRIGEHGSSHHITFFFALPAAVCRHRFDLLVEDFMPPFSVTANPLLTRKPVIGSVQWFGAEPLAKEYGLPFHWVQRPGVRLYRNLVVLTGHMQRHLQRLAPQSRIEVIPNGVDEGLFSLSPRPGHTILYLGRLDLHRKGLGHLLDAYASLRPAGRPPLVLAGFSDQWDTLHARIATLGIGKDVRVFGRFNAADRMRLLEECRFVCFPSPHETFGMVVAEACAAARPVIHFAIPAIEEVASDSGSISVPAFDVAAYSAAMQHLIDASPDEMARRAQCCRVRAAEYRWAAVAAKQETFYSKVSRLSANVAQPE